MSYEPYTWRGGDTVTANKLNHIEQGIAQGGSGGIFYIPNSTVDGQAGIITLGMTAGEISTALQEGKFVFTSIPMEEDGAVLILNIIILGCTYEESSGYAFPGITTTGAIIQPAYFTCDYEDEYPSVSMNGSPSGPGSGGIK